MVRLDSRLNSVVNMIENVDTVYDIGADHGYTSIYLLERNIIKHAVLCDVNEKPLESARKNSEKYYVSSRSDFILSNGFENVDVSAGAGIIAGMGGELIINILKKAKEQKKTNKLDYIVIQPMNSVESLREYLFENGFEIIKEDLVRDKNLFYNILKVKDIGIISDDYKHNEILCLEIGSYLYKSGHKLFKEYINYKLNVEEKILKMCENNDTLKAGKKADIVTKRIEIIKEIIRTYESK